MHKKIDFQKCKSLVLNLFSQEHLDKLRSFFMGRWYPIWVAFSVLLGRLLGLELYFTMFDFVVVSVALLLCDSIRPMIPNLISFIFRIPLEHGPGIPRFSTYYTGTKMIYFAAFSCVFFISLAWFFIRTKPFKGVRFMKIPLIIPNILLSVAFLLSGAFSEGWTVKDLGFGALEAFVFFIVFMILYFGLRKENVGEFCDYFVYICTVTLFILSFQVFELFITNDAVISSAGIIDKRHIFFGWGISNSCASAISVLLPICSLGVMKSRKYSLVYFAILNISFVAMVMTLSRSAVLVGGVCYAACLIICCFFGENKKIYRIIVSSFATLALAVIFVFREKIFSLFSVMIATGLKGNGRLETWTLAIERFKQWPIFGGGFFSYKPDIVTVSTFTPKLAHNTVLQMLASTGAVGLLAYLYYRLCTCIPFFKKVRIESFMLMMSVAILVGESCIDNFILWFSPTFVYNIALIIIFMYNEQQSCSNRIIGDPITPKTTL